MNAELRTLSLVALGSSVVCGLGLGLAYSYFYSKKLGKRGAVKSLYIHPVKSCAGIKLEQAAITKIGVLLDRYVAYKFTCVNVYRVW
jgi:hypothetical protein